MKKNSLIDFSIPTRQSPVAILMIIWKTYRVIVGQVWPILIFAVLGRGSSGLKSHWVIGIVALAVIGMLYSIINYFRFYFYIEKDELVVESGVFKRSKINVPFDRIQTINFEQNIAHRIFDVVRLKIDTAGSAKAEFQFQAIVNEKADALRNLVLSRKKSMPKSDSKRKEATSVKEEKYKTIMNLELWDLIKAGAVENHIKSGGIILAFMWWIWSQLDELKMSGMVEDTVSNQLAGGLFMMIVLFVLFIILSFVVSLFRMIFSNYDLKFMRSSRGFKVNAGLFTKKDTSALDHKIQVVSWADNPLKKLIGIKDLRLKQASSIAINKKTSIRVPSCSQHHIDLVTSTLYGEKALENIVFEGISKKYWYRYGAYMLLITLIIVSVFFYFGQMNQVILFSVFGAFALLSFYLSYRKKRFGYNDEMLAIYGGAYGDKSEVLPIYKIQAMTKSKTPYQRRNNLASLVIYTASGKVSIPYILENRVDEMMDIFLYRVEKDKRKWM